MNFDKYTDRARGFVQSAQSLALREGHQQFAPEHLLKVLLDDPEGLAAGLIDRSGGKSRQTLQAVEAALAKRPEVSGGGAGQIYLDPATVSSPSSGSCLRCRLRRIARQEKSWQRPASLHKISMRQSMRCAKAVPP